MTAVETGAAAQSSASPLLTAALEYLSRGWYVLPLRVGRKPDGRKDVHLPKAWDQLSTNDPAVVASWFGPDGAWADGSVAVDTGKSGLVVVDLDTTGDKNGFAAWEQLGGGLASYVNGTPSGGAHLFYAADPSRPVGNDSKGKLARGIDVRAVGGLVIMPPSADWRGAYRETPARDWQHLTPVPDIVVERVPLGGSRNPAAPGVMDATQTVRRDPSQLGTLVAGDGVPKYIRVDADARMRAVLHRVMHTPEGSGFNHALNEAAFELGHWVGGGHISAGDAESMLSYAVTHVFPYGPNGDDLATISSGLKSGEAKPYAVLPDAVTEVVAGVADYDPFQAEVDKQYARLKALEAARERLAAEKVTGQGDGRVDWDVLDKPPRPVDWQVPELIAAGRSYSIVGGAKSGKSTTARHLAVRAAEAGVPVLYLDRENTWEDDWTPQLRGMGVGREISRTLDVRCFPAIPPLDTEAGGNQLVEWVQAGGIRIVFLDMFLRFLAGKENDSDTFNAFDRYTGQKLKAMGVTLVRLDHSGKTDTDSARGSSGKSGDVDVQWMLTRDGGRVTLDPKGITRKSDQRGAVTLIVQGGRLVPADESLEPVAGTQADETLQRYLGMLLDQGTITLKTAGATVLRLLQERGQSVRKSEFYAQWKLFLADRGDGVAAETRDSKRTKLTPFPVSGAVPSDHENGGRELGSGTVPGTGSQDHGTAGTVDESSGPDQVKRDGNHGSKSGNH